MSKVVKEMLMNEIREQLGDSRDLLVIDSAKLDAVATNQFRLAMQEKSISVLTVRNSLAKRALHDVGITALDDFLNGPSTLIWGGEDAVALSKEIAKWVKDLGALEIKGGSVEGTPLTADEVDALSKSPSREELIAQISGLLLSPGGRLSAALLGPGGKLNGQIEALAEKEDGEA